MSSKCRKTTLAVSIGLITSQELVIPPRVHKATTCLPQEHGLCVLEPFSFAVEHSLFVEVRIPSGDIIRGTQVSVEATVFNFVEQRIQVGRQLRLYFQQSALRFFFLGERVLYYFTALFRCSPIRMYRRVAAL